MLKGGDQPVKVNPGDLAYLYEVRSADYTGTWGSAAAENKLYRPQ